MTTISTEMLRKREPQSVLEAHVHGYKLLDSAINNVADARARLNAPGRREKKKEKREGEDPYYTPAYQLEESIDCNLGRNFDVLLTRNHYGCLVINASHALFIDVDTFVPDEIYNPLQGREDRVRSLRQEVLCDLRTVLRNEDEYGFRIYQTAGGFRILATTHEFEAGSSQAERLMDAVGADRNFVELCRKQNNFRARLSPKPWRCGLHRPPNSFPRNSAKAEERFQKWLSDYNRACASRATCKFVETVGREYVHERVAPIIEFHDRETKAITSLPLA